MADRLADQFSKLVNQSDNDPRGWARRILDRHAFGASVAPIALKFAREALRIRDDHVDAETREPGQD